MFRIASNGGLSENTRTGHFLIVFQVDLNRVCGCTRPLVRLESPCLLMIRRRMSPGFYQKRLSRASNLGHVRDVPDID
jgi:hypothetical protein